MPALSITDLNNAKQDVDHIAAVATSSANAVTDRLGNTKPTLASAVASVAAISNRGSWAATTAYAIKDVVSVSGVFYICVDAHTSGVSFAGDEGNYWRIYQGALLHEVGRVVSSIAALRLIDKSKVTRAFVAGYYGSGDGGGGAYYLDASDTISTDNGGTVIVGADGGRWKLLHDGRVTIKQFGAKADGTDCRAIVIDALEIAAEGGFTIVSPAGTFSFSDWVPLPSNLRLSFDPGSLWKLTAITSLGGFVCGGYDLALNPVAFDNVDIHGIALDCNSIGGENGFNAVNATSVRIYNPRIYNCAHHSVALGGRAFQFEGAQVDGVHVYAPYIENCSIGINSQGSPDGSKRVRNINYYDVVMRDVDVPFNIDSQFASPDSNTLLTMGTFVHGAQLYNCGRITWSGDTTSGLGGGIVCGDRGYGLKISGLRVVNDVSYPAIGALVRGVMFGVELRDVQIQAPYISALFDFSKASAFSSASDLAFASTIYADDIKVKCDMDYVVKGGASTGRIGSAMMRNVQIHSTTATIAGIMDANAGSASNAYLELVLADQGFKTSGLRTLKNIYDAGNSVAVCFNEAAEGTWTPIDASTGGLTLAVVGTPTYVRRGRLVTATFAVTYPTTTHTGDAIIGGLPFAADTITMAGSLTIGFTNESTLNAGYVAGGSTSIILSTASGPSVQNAALSGDTIYGTVTYLAA